MLLRRYLERINSSTMPAEDITELFRKPVMLANSLLRPCTESPVPCHAEMIRCLVEAYPFLDDVEGKIRWMKHLVSATQRTSPRFDYRGYVKHGKPNTGNGSGFDKTGHEVELCYEAWIRFISSKYYVSRP